MKDFLANYGGTIIILVLILIIVFLSVKRLIKNRKSGKCSCGCEGCSFKNNCHKK